MREASHAAGPLDADPDARHSDGAERALLLAAAGAPLEVPLRRIVDWALEALEPLVPHHGAGWGIGTHDPPSTHAMHLRRVPPALMLAYEGGGLALDYLRFVAAGLPGVTINDADLRGHHPEIAAALEDVICRPFGIRHALVTSLPDPDVAGLHHLLMLWRGCADEPFTEIERRRMERIAPHLLAAWRVARRLHLASAGRRPAEGRALVDRRGRLHAFDLAIVRQLRAIDPDWTGPSLPSPLFPLAAGASSSLCCSGTRFAAEAVGELVELSARSDPLLLLPPAERAVAERWAAGASARAIAAELGRSVATVRNQVASAYARLGVSSRLALARRLKAA
ncbi:MAG: LuxR C-terminal-related transcriptional regulator [Sphingomonadaceae bacterium]|uniref:helix-turn-helix transcriptional regulator n=1 Tax=Thermaurantiacus sp. TaxID=2820283 RepID=UPI00298F3932|nr:LuxR C-terminal-related transcriptional regulator [Thermaurantiacus sp.]MCS6986404.1 LuxR C-terminal-related transcriptional regulator [Sphingomonadaceae bacterium]MDW8414335.1 LuxR C-terminal-related transcriptional regulator [Thermaurantiacus sp.]